VTIYGTAPLSSNGSGKIFDPRELILPEILLEN
jgi:hypothetical protein